ncbi:MULTISPECIES: LysR family transcriptional regulator [unclassified Endozoicomonas]|uniref:LysR family transcriptional regulator n=1 Tax=unclassified Endozoicomonas TaxID=2644528 RepID=UPI003BB6B02C
MSKATLDQWRMLQAVVEHGGFAQASEAIFKSQSTISCTWYFLTSAILALPHKNWQPS